MKNSQDLKHVVGILSVSSLTSLTHPLPMHSSKIIKRKRADLASSSMISRKYSSPLQSSREIYRESSITTIKLGIQAAVALKTYFAG